MSNSNRWNVGEAKQQFSEVLRRSAKEPQLVYRREELIAAVVHAENAEAIPGESGPSLADRFAEARGLLGRQRYAMPNLRRSNRRNSFGETLDVLARRHKRSE